MGTYKNPRRPGYPYHGQRDELGRFKPVPRSLTLKDKIKRRYPHKLVAGLTAKQYQQFKELSLTLGVPMSDILAYLITNHLEQLALQASYEQGRTDAADNSQGSAENSPS